MSELRKTTPFNFDESIEIQYRLSELVGALDRQYINFIVSIFIITGIIIIPLQASISEKTIAMIFFNSIGIIVSKFAVPHGLRKASRKFLIKCYSEGLPKETETILNDSGISFNTSGVTISFEWNMMREYRDNDEFIEIETFPMGLMRFYKHNYSNSEFQELLSFIFSHAQNLNAHSA